MMTARSSTRAIGSGAAVLLAALALTGCTKKATSPTTQQSLSGVVRVSNAVQSNVPLAGVTVSLGGASTASTTTAADGSWSFAGLASGTYTVHATHASHALSPAGYRVELPGAATGHDFRATPAVTKFNLTGTIGGAGMAGVRLALTGEGAGEAISQADGTWSMPGLIIGDYTLTPTRDGYHFSPPSRTILGNVAFEHPETGNGTLGSVTVASITWNAQDASAFFEVTNPPVDGAGTLRARRRSEIAAGQLAAYDAMWDAGGVVVVAVDTALGTYSIQVFLGPNPTITTSSATFLMQESLAFPGGNDFTAIGH